MPIDERDQVLGLGPIVVCGIPFLKELGTARQRAAALRLKEKDGSLWTVDLVEGFSGQMDVHCNTTLGPPGRIANKSGLARRVNGVDPVVGRRPLAVVPAGVELGLRGKVAELGLYGKSVATIQVRFEGRVNGGNPAPGVTAR